MKSKIDIDSWNRREHFNFFINFDDPFFGLTTKLDCTRAYQKCKKEGTSLYFYYVYQSLKAANQIENFRYRIIDNEVWCFDNIHVSATSLRPDETFGFTFVEFSESLEEFIKQATLEKEAVNLSSGLRFNENTSRMDTIHYSAIPWIDFTSLSHARSFKHPDSCPKISFGKIHEENGKKVLPFSIHVHHALMDGKHVADYLELLQQLLNK